MKPLCAKYSAVGILLLLPLLLFPGCRSQPVPSWKLETQSRFEAFQRAASMGDFEFADSQFQAAVEIAAARGDIETVARLMIRRNAVHLACGLQPDWDPFDEIAPYLQDGATRLAGEWMRSRPISQEHPDYPFLEKDRRWLAQNPSAEEWRKRIVKEQDTLRKLLYSRIYLSNFPNLNDVALEAANVASEAGWRSAFLYFGKLALDALEKTHDPRVEWIRVRLRLAGSPKIEDSD